MNFDLPKINLSKNDVKRKVKIPRKLSNLLAYDIDIMIGDGNLYKKCDKHKRTSYEISYHGNLKDEKLFYSSFLKQIKFRLFNINPIYYPNIAKSTCSLKFFSRGIFEFYTNVIGLPIGNKCEIKIPKFIF